MLIQIGTTSVQRKAPVQRHLRGFVPNYRVLTQLEKTLTLRATYATYGEVSS